ncbi:hypothetical protein EMIT0324P_20480 [Pseudomonas chlororaphis]
MPCSLTRQLPPLEIVWLGRDIADPGLGERLCNRAESIWK